MPAPTYSHDELVAAILAFEEEQEGDELEENMDAIISLGEVMLLKDLDLTIFDSLEDIVFTAGNPVVAKPDDTISTLMLWRSESSVDTPLDQRTLEFCKDYNPNPATTGTPLYWAESSEDEYYVSPSPAAPLAAGRALVNTRPASIITDTTGTFLSTRAGDALLHACLISAEKFIKDDERIKVWRGEYDARILPATRRELAALTRRRYPA